MYLSAAVLFAASLALYGACGFVAPAAPPASTEVARGSAAAALTAGEQGADVQTTSAWSPLAIGAALGLLVAVAGASPAEADLENGESVFLGNCAACHAGGNNSVVTEKV